MRCLPLVVVACAAPQGAGGPTPAWVGDTSSYGAPAIPAPTAVTRGTGIAGYGAKVAAIIAAARADHGAYAKLAELTDTIGNRISGSKQLDAAIAWAAKVMQADGHDVKTEPVMVPAWVRGPEDAAIVQPITRPLRIIGLGGTVATPKGGITAPVVVVHSFDELDQRGDALKGKIVLYDVAMPAWTEQKGSGYGETVEYRGHGPSRAAKHGAVAVLVRSVTAHSLRTPHTGATHYDDGIPKIPAAAVTVEDSTLLARMVERGPVTVHLAMDSRVLPDAKSANVIGELRGRDKPDEVVVIGAHIDSWDVGQGAHDDGAGCATVMQALTLLRRLSLTPRRTIRVVLFTNEENGLRGGTQYALDHSTELAHTVLALETDSGGFAPRGFSIDAKPEVTDRVAKRIGEIAALLAPIHATRVNAGHGGGADVHPMVAQGVPTVGLDVDGRTYFDIHHTDADTLDKVDPAALADDVAAVAVLAYIVADLPDRIDAP